MYMHPILLVFVSHLKGKFVTICTICHFFVMVFFFSFGNPELFCKQSYHNNIILRRKLSCLGIIIFSETYIIAYHVPLKLESKSYEDLAQSFVVITSLILSQLSSRILLHNLHFQDKL